MSALPVAYLSRFSPQATKCWGGPNIQFCTPYGRKQIATQKKTEWQRSKRKEIDRPASIPFSLCHSPLGRPRDLVILHRNGPLIRLAPSFPIHPLVIKPFPPQRWSQVGPCIKQQEAPPSLAPSFLLSFSPPLLHTFRHTPCRPRQSRLAHGRQRPKRSILPIPP